MHVHVCARVCVVCVWWMARNVAVGQCIVRMNLAVFDETYPSLVPSLLDVTANDKFDWPDLANGEPTYRISVLETLLDLGRIPFVKRAAYLLSSSLFACFFVVVAFQPLCGPLNFSHYLFGGWIVSVAAHQAFHLLSPHRRKYWYTPYPRPSTSPLLAITPCDHSAATRLLHARYTPVTGTRTAPSLLP